MYTTREVRETSPHLSPETKAWHKQVHWMQDNNALYYCEKVFKHKDFGWGIYEGQCDKFGNCLGVGRWLCQDRIRPHWWQLVEEGYYKNDKVEGLAVQLLTNGDRFVAEYRDGNLMGAITGFLGD